MHTQRWTALLGAVVISLAAGQTLRARVEVVATDLGSVSGLTGRGGVTAFLGVPYAAPPVGDLRWRPPQPAARWEGVRKTQTFGASCMQAQPGSRLPWTEEFMTQGPISEDCLFLNVWTVARTPNARLPVMVWIYGGGFNEGSGSVAVYDGTELARKGVIVVSLNYRVGALGFLAHPELTRESEHKSSGNYGLLDQIAALQWINRNIAAFGGNPAQVTIFGQSAGASAVMQLMRSPLAKGLFVRAIAQSGPGRNRPPAAPTPATIVLADREAAGARYMESQGARTLSEMRALPASTFFAAPPAGSSAVTMPGGPFTDGWVLTPEQTTDQVPLIAGFTADDLGLGGGAASAKASIAAYESDARRLYGDQAAAFLKLYPAASDADVPRAQKTAARDRARVSMDIWADEQMKVSKRVYTYYFDRAIPWPAHPEFGAFHTGEVPYVFNTLARLNRPWEPADLTLAEAMSSYWANFGKKGDPNGTGLARWPQYAPGTHTTMQLGARLGTMSVADTARLDFLLAQLQKGS